MNHKNTFYKLSNFNSCLKNCKNFLLNNFIDLFTLNLNLTENNHYNSDLKLYKHTNIHYLIHNKLINKFKTVENDNKYKKIYYLKTTIILKNLIKICTFLRENFFIIYDNFKNYIHNILKKNFNNIKKHTFIKDTKKYEKNKYSSSIYINTKSKKNIFEKCITLNKKEHYLIPILKKNINNFIYYKNNNTTTYIKNNIMYKNLSTYMLIKNRNINIYDSIKSFDKSLKQIIFGQNKNIEKISQKLSNVDNNKYTKPIFSVLLCGPSGTGKTEISKIISRRINNGQTNLIHLDMSEYMESHSVSKIIGSPPGYKGSKKGGELVKNIINKPNSVVLFDEIEKADDSIYAIFLQLLDEGVLTDSKGTKGYFDKSIVIFTSNIGSDVFEDVGVDKILTMNYEDQIKQKINEHFRPELINRLDDIIIFNPLFSGSIYPLINKIVYNQKNININKKIKCLLSLVYCAPTKGSRFIFSGIDKILSNINILENINFNYNNKLIKCHVI